MQLPGGLFMDGELRRDFSFRPINGELELKLRETAAADLSHPQKVSIILQQALAGLGQQDATPDRVWQLSVGDRQFLLRQLGIAIEDSPLWLSSRCVDCGELFEINIRQSELPVKECGSGYPETQVTLSVGPVSVRVPDGNIQEQVARETDDRIAMQLLLAATVTTLPGQAVNVEKLSAQDITQIEATMEALSPEVSMVAVTDCPHCERRNQIRLSPYYCMQQPSEELYTEIHNLAMSYHWSEASILAMPRERRKSYLRLLDKSRGMQIDAGE